MTVQRRWAASDEHLTKNAWFWEWVASGVASVTVWNTLAPTVHTGKRIMYWIAHPKKTPTIPRMKDASGDAQSTCEVRNATCEAQPVRPSTFHHSKFAP